MPNKLTTNKIYQGDCLKILKTFPDECVDMIMTDPPYNISQKGLKIDRTKIENRSLRRKGKRSKKLNYDFGSWDQFNDRDSFLEWTDQWVKECFRILKPTGNFVSFFSKSEISYFEDILNKYGHVRQTIVWHKCIANVERVIIKRQNKIEIINIKDLIRLRNIKDLKIIGTEGWVDVLGVDFSHKEKGIKIICDNGFSIRVSSRHRLPVNSITNLIEAKNIKIGDILFTANRYPCLPVYNNYNLGYLVGLFLAEGNFTHNSHQGIELSLHKKENLFVKRISDYLETIGITVKEYNFNLSKHLRVNNKIVYTLLKKHIIGETSHTKHLNYKFLSFGLNYIKGVFDGFLDGDGYYDKVAKRYRINITTNKKLVEQLNIISKFLGYKLRFRKRNIWNKKVKKSYRCFEITITRNKNDNNIDKVKVVKIVSEKQKINYSDISIKSKDSLFCNYGGILSHNTNPVPQIFKVGFMSSVEFMSWATKQKGAKHTFNYKLGQHHNFIETPICMGNERKKHPTQKPKKAIAWLINYLSNQGDIICDPFLGSGTTAVVARNLGRDWVGIELSKSYIKIAQKRLAQRTLGI